MHRNDYPAFVLNDRNLRRRDDESRRPHLLDENFTSGTAWVCEEDLPVFREEFRYETGERGDVAPFVEYVGGEDEIEGFESVRFRVMPVEEPGLYSLPGVLLRVVRREVERGCVVVGGGYVRAARRRDDGRKPDAATEFYGTFSGQVELREVFSKPQRARPEVGPVRDAFVAGELALVEEGFGGFGVCEGECLARHPDFSGCEAGATADVLLEIRGVYGGGYF